MIIINEEIIGKELDRNGITSNKDALKLGMILIKYYKYLGLNNTEIKDKLLKKIHIQNDEDKIISDYIYNTLVLNINVCGEFKNSPTPITTSELELIHSLNNTALEKFFFVFVVLCKVFNNSVRLSKREILRMAMLPEKTETFDKMIDVLLNKGYVDIKVGKYKVKEIKKTDVFYFLTDDVLQIYKEEEVAFYIDKTNNPVLYYLWYYEMDNVVFCEECGTPYIKSVKQTRGKTLCQMCQENRHRESSKISMRKLRKNVDDQSREKS